MAKNRYHKQWQDFCKWFDCENDTMPADLRGAALRFRAALWAAAHNPKPLPGFSDELAKFMQARNQAGAVQN